MDSDGAALQQPTREQCLALMASVAVGRIVYTRRALPAVELVSFTLDRGDIIIKTDHSGKLAAAAGGAVVAFEVDSLDAGRHVGWSVTAIGHSHEVTDPGEVLRLDQAGLDSWDLGERSHYLRISPGILNGRWLAAHRRQLGFRV
jgi:uncharacterized protein